MLLNIVAGATTRHLLHVARRGALIERRLRATLDSISHHNRRSEDVRHPGAPLSRTRDRDAIAATAVASLAHLRADA
jgi:hypothetical protein